MKAIIFFVNLFCWAFSVQAAEPASIKIGVQAAGTLAWELAVIENDVRFKPAKFRLQIRELANAEAGKIALQSGSVDMIVSDWIWVSRLRDDGVDFTFYPYSTMSGALVVPAVSPIKSIKDLAGKRLGIAGGEFDKNWLLLQALAKQDNIDLDKTVEKVYGAPPLIDEQLRQGRIDAALTYWHFAAKLEAQGYRQLVDGKGILQALGIEELVPSLGFVFKQSWAEKNNQALSAFFEASVQAKRLICSEENVWTQIVPLLQAGDAATQKILRQRFCAGQVLSWNAKVEQAAERIYGFLKELSNNQLTGKANNLHPGTFWHIGENLLTGTK